MLRASLIAFLAFSMFLRADSLLPPMNVGIAQVELSTFTNGLVVNQVNQEMNGSPATLTASQSISGGTFSGSMFGQAEFGVLKASSSSMLTGTTSPVNTLAAGSAFFNDVVTVEYAPLNGDLGLMQLSYNLNGTTTQSGSLASVLNVYAFACSDVNLISYACNDPIGIAENMNFQSATSGVFTFPDVFDFRFGQPFDLFFELSAVNGTFTVQNIFNVGSLLGLSSYYTTLPGSTRADASNTLAISNISIFDSQMDPVAGYTVTTGSGTSYPFVGAVPEPSTFSLLLLGAGLLMGRKVVSFFKT
jgi:hypothetical protein